MIIKIKDIPENTCGIYKLTYPNGKIYIGQSVNIKRRMYEHNNPRRLQNHKWNPPCDLAILKYGKFEEIEILDLCRTKEELDQKEKYWIKYFKSNNKNFGYNLTEGGNNKTLSGEKSNSSVFSNKEVLNIRKRRYYGERKIDVYQNYKDRNFSTFEKIWLGRGYPEVGKEFLIPVGAKTRKEYSSIANSGEKNGRAKLNEEAVKEIRRRYDSGESISQILKDFSFVGKSTIRRVCKRETWKNVI